MAQGLAPSTGLIVVAGADLSELPNDTIVPVDHYKVLADHRSGTYMAKDWYPDGTPFNGDRGKRNPNVINYYDGGETRPNPPTRPTIPPASGAQWLSPAPDQKGRFVWGDTYNGAVAWIVGSSKRGFIAIASLARGAAWYGGSTLHYDAVDIELQIYSEDTFGEVLAGTLQPWDVAPISSRLLTDEMKGAAPVLDSNGSGATRGVAGATFDATTNTLWLLVPSSDGGYGCQLFAYKVNC
jgi:hypothetical protein